MRQREWENSGIKFKPPAKESDHCFFVANASALDQEQGPRFVWRSAATLRVELKGMRVATTKKIRAEREARAKANRDAIDVFEGNAKLWAHVGGVDTDFLENPSLEAIARAQEACAHLVKLKDANRDSGDNTCGLADDLI